MKVYSNHVHTHALAWCLVRLQFCLNVVSATRVSEARHSRDALCYCSESKPRKTSRNTDVRRRACSHPDRVIKLLSYKHPLTFVRAIACDARVARASPAPPSSPARHSGGSQGLPSHAYSRTTARPIAYRAHPRPTTPDTPRHVPATPRRGPLDYTFATSTAGATGAGAAVRWPQLGPGRPPERPRWCTAEWPLGRRPRWRRAGRGSSAPTARPHRTSCEPWGRGPCRRRCRRRCSGWLRSVT